jgi:SPP1 gp7 family putative phage head morphogenesis protein
MRRTPAINTRNPKTPWDFIEAQRKELLALDESALNDIASAYDSASRKAFRELERVMNQIQRALERGEAVHPNWLWRQERWSSLLVQMGSEMELFGKAASSTIDRLGIASAHLGGDHAGKRLDVVGPDVAFNLLPREALDMMVAQLRVTAPAGALLNGIALTAKKELQNSMIDAMRTELTNGIALGRNPRDVARSMYAKVKNDVDGVTYRRAELIARTESMRTYRAAQTENYRRNDDVVEGWIWVASLNAFTCPACLAKHMTQHPLSKDMMSHPACRCTAMPMVDDEKPDLPFGDEWLRDQSEDVQKRIMGSPTRWQMWKNGDVTLEDCVTTRNHPIWGESVNVTPIRDLRRIKSGDVPSRPNAIWNPRNDPISIPAPAPAPVAPPTQTPRRRRPPTRTTPTVAPPAPVAAPVPVTPPTPKPTAIIDLRKKSNLTGTESMDEFEAIARKQSVDRLGAKAYESAAVYDPDGKLIFMRDGESSQVAYTVDEAKQFKGGTLTHNHPRGSSFSESDVAFMIRQNLREIRAVGEKYTYRLINDDTNVLDPDGKMWFASSLWNKKFQDLYPKYAAMALPDGSNINLLSMEHTHEVMESVAQSVGFRYERIDMTPAPVKPTAPPEPPKPKYVVDGLPRKKKDHVTIINRSSLDAETEKLLGVDLEDFASNIVPKNNKNVQIDTWSLTDGRTTDINSIEVTVYQPDGIKANRTFFPREGIVSHDLMKIDKSARGSGIGVFASQVQAYRKAGYKTIKTYAARGPEYNGYYTWARFGFDVDLQSARSRSLRYDLEQAGFGKLNKLSELMSTQKGRDWWKVNGQGIDMEFDLTDDSVSMEVLDAYIQERMKKGDFSIVNVAQWFNRRDDGDDVENPPYLTRTQSRLLDRAWDSIRRRTVAT